MKGKKSKALDVPELKVADVELKPEEPVRDFLIQVRMAVRHGFHVPDVLVRDGRKFRVVDRQVVTVGLVSPASGIDGLYPLADITMVDEFLLTVVELPQESL